MSRLKRILPLVDWPAADREKWQAAVQSGGLFDDIGPLAHLSDATRNMILSGYGKWLTWLSETHPSSLSKPPQDRITIECFVAFDESNAHLAPSTRHLYASDTLRFLSRCYPDNDWDRLWKFVHHLKRGADEHDSHRKDGRILSGRYTLTKSLEFESDSENVASPHRRALQQRNGTILAFLSLIPLRRRAFTSLCLGESIVCDGGDIHIVTRPELTKTKTFWNTQVPPVLVPALQRYIDETRPWLMTGKGVEHDRLWVTKDGLPLSGTAMGTLVRIQTCRLFDVNISPHLFRDIAATTLARTSPEAVGHLRALLNHSGHETAEKFYNQATTLEVGRDHGRLIDNLKKGK